MLNKYLALLLLVKKVILLPCTGVGIELSHVCCIVFATFGGHLFRVGCYAYAHKVEPVGIETGIDCWVADTVAHGVQFTRLAQQVKLLIRDPCEQCTAQCRQVLGRTLSMLKILPVVNAPLVVQVGKKADNSPVHLVGSQQQAVALHPLPMRDAMARTKHPTID